MANRYTNVQKPEQAPIKLDKYLLDIMRTEFPDDLLYQSGELTPQPLQDVIVQVTQPKEYNPAERNGRNILQMTPSRVEHVNYLLTKSVPSVDDETLDDLLDEEWNYFTDTPSLINIDDSNLFLIHPLQSISPVDFHDAYLTRGPQFIGSTDSVDDIFCIYFVRNGVAYPIPNYKTLEVMLVERKLTYNNIVTASDLQIQQYDLNMDGITDIVNTRVSPDAEFEARALADRSNEWNYQVRYDSGYRPREPFKRDPGDYFNPILRTYFDTVFQGQTFKEALRARFEGSMVILAWPDNDDPNNEFDIAVTRNDNAQANDLVNSVRIMTNGYWKQVTDGPVFRAYAYIKGVNITGYQDPNGRYGKRGYINLLVNNGGITVLAAENITDSLDGDDIAWNSFPHIVEVDRLDLVEYENYINLYSNNPFNNDYLRPYEPEGSLKYYDKTQLTALAQQASQQELVDSIIDSISERYEDLASLAGDINNTIASSNFRCVDRLNNITSELVRIGLSDDRWLFVKRKSNDVKVKTTEHSLFRLIEKTQKITANLDRDEENNIVSGWSRVPPQNPPSQLQYDGPGNFNNFDKFEVPRDWNGRDRAAMKEDEYIEISMLAAFYSKDVNKQYNGYDEFYSQAQQLDTTRSQLTSELTIILKSFEQIETDIAQSTTVEQFQLILDRLNNIEQTYNIARELIDNVNNFNSELDRIAKKYVLSFYTAVQTLRKLVYERSGSGSKYGIIWPNSAIKIINKYIPGKIFDNYQPEG